MKKETVTSALLSVRDVPSSSFNHLRTHLTRVRHSHGIAFIQLSTFVVRQGEVSASKTKDIIYGPNIIMVKTNS